MSQTAMPRSVVVVGGGHNGLVAAAYLARAGADVLVLERRDFVGGACITEELFPRFRVSSCSYICHLLQRKVIDDLQLRDHGFAIHPVDPYRFQPFPSGSYLLRWHHAADSEAEIARLAPADVQGYRRYRAFMDRAAALDALPDFRGHLGDRYDEKLLVQVRICPSVDYFLRSGDDARAGRPSSAPVMHIQIPSVLDRSLVPAGKHVMSVWVLYAPVRPRQGSWDELREQTGERIIDVIGEYAPGFRESVRDWMLFTPRELEQRVALTDGNIRHLDMTSAQMLANRPNRLLSGYRTPVPGLYLCGAGTHPGGEVTGAPGHNAAHAILHDWESPG